MDIFIKANLKMIKKKDMELNICLKKKFGIKGSGRIISLWSKKKLEKNQNGKNSFHCLRIDVFFFALFL